MKGSRFSPCHQEGFGTSFLLIAMNKDYKIDALFLFYLLDMVKKKTDVGANDDFMVDITNLLSSMDLASFVPPFPL